MMAPAARNLATAGASASGRRSFSAGAPTLAVNPDDIERVLDADRQAFERARLAARDARIGFGGGGQRAGGIESDQRIEPRD